MSALKERIIKNVSGLENKIDLQHILDYLSFLKEKEEWDATLEILRDKKTMKRIKKGLRDIKHGKVYDFDEIKRHV
jgi:hypothetical protein